MKSTIKILHLEDVSADAELAARELKKCDIFFEHLVIDTKDEYVTALKQFKPDVILCDHSLPAFNSYEALKLLKESATNIPFILITATMSEDVAEKIVKNGADDYILKDRLKRLPHALINALEKYRHESDRKYLIQQVVEKDLEAKYLLQQINNKLFLATKAAQIGVWELYLETGQIVGDDIWQRIYGLSSRNITFSEWQTYLHPLDAERVLGEVHDCLTEKSDFYSEFRIVRNGVTEFIKATGLLEKIADDTPWRLVGTNQNITSQKRAEHTLKAEEAKYRSFFENSMDAILLTATDGRILSANPAACALFQRTSEEMCQIQRGEIVDISDKALKQILIDRRRTGKIKGELTFFRKDRTKFKGDVTSAIFTDSYSEERTCVIIRDITERKQLEAILQMEKQRYMDLFIQAPSCIVLLTGPNYIYEAANPNYYKLTGRKDIIGKSIRDILPELESQGLFTRLDEVYQTGIPFIGTEVFIKLDKAGKGNLSGLYLNFIYQPYKNSAGNVEGIVFFANDVTEQVQARQRIEESERKYKQLFLNSPAPQFIFHQNTLQIQTVNCAAVTHYGYSKKEFAALKFVDLIDDESAGTFMEKWLHDPKDTKKANKWISHQRKKDGEHITVEVTAALIEHNNLPCVLASISDITEQLQLQHKISELKVLAQKEITNAQIKAQESERQHIAEELHDDINQRLATVKLYLDVAFAHDDMRMDLIKTCEQLVNSTISDIRIMCRSLIPIGLRNSNFTEAIGELLGHYKFVQKFKVHLESHPCLQNLPDDLKLSLYRIVQEQLNNITKYAEAKNAWVCFAYTDGHLILRIKDDGKGCNLKTKKQGLGMANIKSRIEVHLGKMHVTSGPGKGYEINVHIPYAFEGHTKCQNIASIIKPLT